MIAHGINSQSYISTGFWLELIFFCGIIWYFWCKLFGHEICFLLTKYQGVFLYNFGSLCRKKAIFLVLGLLREKKLHQICSYECKLCPMKSLVFSKIRINEDPNGFSKFVILELKLAFLIIFLESSLRSLLTD